MMSFNYLDSFPPGGSGKGGGKIQDNGTIKSLYLQSNDNCYYSGGKARIGVVIN